MSGPFAGILLAGCLCNQAERKCAYHDRIERICGNSQTGDQS